ncbi:MAG: sulfotransferase family protein [Bacteroidetes bacterium]|nr:MAG: sulfotransferase family protein [Bacteroidota bacterium]
MNHPLINYIPFRLDFASDEILCKWLFIENKKFTEPFFQETTGFCKGFEENRKPIKSVSTLENLIEFSETIPTIAPTAFIFHVSRCGSTLLAQLLSLDSQHIVLAEAPILDEIIREISFNKPNINDSKINQYFKAAIKILGQIRTGNESHLFIKLDSWHIFYYQKLRELYPNTPFLFSYRQPNEVIRSQINQSGMHAAPGVIQPALFGFDLFEILKLSRPEYIAKVLEVYFEKFIEIQKTDKNAHFYDYKEGILTNLEKIIALLNLQIDTNTKEKMKIRSQFHSKMPNTVFSEAQIEKTIPKYQQKAMNLYAILNENILKNIT